MRGTYHRSKAAWNICFVLCFYYDLAPPLRNTKKSYMAGSIYLLQ
jgi:hypothetical protein